MCERKTGWHRSYMRHGCLVKAMNNTRTQTVFLLPQAVGMDGPRDAGRRGGRAVPASDPSGEGLPTSTELSNPLRRPLTGPRCEASREGLARRPVFDAGARRDSS
jgi:hypothetical protein